MNTEPRPAAPTPVPPKRLLRVRVWDRFVRVFHWALAACVLADVFVYAGSDPLHHGLGYAAVALVLARVYWGFAGSYHARFSTFFPTPDRLDRHLSGLLGGQVEFHAGHNPLGALMVLVLLALVLALGLTGFLQGTDRYWGVAWLQDLHAWLGDTLIVLAGLHAVAALVMGRLARVRLVRAMVTGVKSRF